MKVIFLDIDGVLNSSDYLHATYGLRRAQAEKRKLDIKDINAGLQQTRDKFGQLFDPRCVAHLARIIEHTGAIIVVSSTWRYSGTKGLQELWDSRDLPGEIYDITKPPGMPLSFETSERWMGHEIKDWLLSHPYVKDYVILDDDSDMLDEQKEHFVQTSTEFGLTFETSSHAIKILNHTEEP